MEYERYDNPFLDGGNYERYLFMDYLLKGSTLQAKYISDLCRAVDVLEQISEVDNTCIGTCGHSLGGQQTMWLGWYDERVRAVAASCGFSQVGQLQSAGINHNFAMYLPSLLQKGDISEVLATLCPKPLFMSHGSQDSLFPLTGVNELTEKARVAYQNAGASGNFRAVIFDGGHVFSPQMQNNAIDFLDEFLKK